MSRKNRKNRLNILGIDLKALVEQVVLEETKDLSGEKDLQKSKASELKPFKHRDEDKDADEGEDSGSDDKKNTTTVKVKKDTLPEITLGKIIDLINMIRSGKSMKDKAVLSSLKSYYQKLNGSERVALYAFLTGISGLVVEVDDEQGASDGAESETPSQEPFGIEMKKQTPK